MVNKIVTKKYIVENKVFAYVLGFGSVLFAYGGLFLLSKIGILSKDIEVYPFYTFPFYILFVFLIKDFLWFKKVVFAYLSIGFILTILGSIFYLLDLAEKTHLYLSIGIYIFLALFILSYSWDMFILIQDNGVEKIVKTYTQRLKKLNKENNKPYIKIVSVDFIKTNYNYKSTKFLKVFIIFALPFALLGKGLSYALAMGVGAFYQDGHTYIISTLGIAYGLLMGFGFFPITIAFWKLKYPTELKQNS